ncbi:methyl-accepting chemotaxis protein [Pseudogemmobacter humi]|uniref:Uncharacterized protein n=1 Tax=Pseudogemmobacter humi TaxID=2483812 RepID=A0A3P5WQ70_9RHOB|nr:methyl-accepting chemotaxis protein [Pseudogemmobacter humi]VDC23755.1 hypothetical protein XINFAN_01168 [Pseudogemmobacter humi]
MIKKYFTNAGNALRGVVKVSEFCALLFAVWAIFNPQTVADYVARFEVHLGEARQSLAAIKANTDKLVESGQETADNTRETADNTAETAVNTRETAGNTAEIADSSAQVAANTGETAQSASETAANTKAISDAYAAAAELGRGLTVSYFWSRSYDTPGEITAYLSVYSNSSTPLYEVTVALFTEQGEEVVRRRGAVLVGDTGLGGTVTFFSSGLAAGQSEFTGVLCVAGRPGQEAERVHYALVLGGHREPDGGVSFNVTEMVVGAEPAPFCAGRI